MVQTKVVWSMLQLAPILGQAEACPTPPPIRGLKNVFENRDPAFRFATCWAASTTPLRGRFFIVNFTNLYFKSYDYC